MIATRAQVVSQNGIAMDKLLESIKNHRALHTLIVQMKPVTAVITTAQLWRLVEEHRRLRTLHLELYRFPWEQAINLICNLKSLQEFKYRVNNKMHKKKLNQQLAQSKFLARQGAKWTDVSTDDNIVFLKRQDKKSACM